MRLLAIPLLMVLPGAWVAFGPRRLEIPWSARLALAVVLSPLVLPAQVIGLELLGVGFSPASWAALVLNLPALVLIWRRSSRPVLAADRGEWPAILGVMAVLMAYLVFPWRWTPMRTLAWHNLMQVDVIYTLARPGPIAPEEAQMAGLPLAYPWLGHLYFAVVGWVSDVPPTLLFCAIQPALLLACVALWYLAVRGLGGSRASAVLAVGLIGLGGNLLATSWGVLEGDRSRASQIANRFGEKRTGPFLDKFYQLQVMPFGLAAYSGLVFVAVRASIERLRSLPLLIGALVLTVGLTYTTILPAAALPGGVLLLLMLLPLSKDLPGYGKGDALRLTLALAAAGLASLGFLEWITRELTAPSAQVVLSPRPLLSKLIRGTLALAVPAAPAALLLLRTARQRRAPMLVLAGTAIGSAALYAVLRLGVSNPVEYKFLFCAIIPLGVLAGLAFDGLTRRAPRASWAAVAALLLGTQAIAIHHGFRLGAHQAPHAGSGPRMVERSFWLDLDPSESDAGWTRAVRERTPPSTILVTDRTRHHPFPFAARSLLVPADRGEMTTRAGYEEAGRYNLVDLRAYPAGEFDRRLGLIDRLATESDPEALRLVLDELLALGRPLAIHFDRRGPRYEPGGGPAAPGGPPPALDWLRADGPGTLLYEDDRHAVWFIEPGEAGAP
ncbi:hypothetical protein [Tautonia plasticadhaerens]|uniref:Uncharacterized protein n=1 Tax=Tautonia plasticadhaerens TaxID=2527974 RepID=A0A518H3D3_9BACT|nr:hypothetical protein [Tautonia plasticadhaerens]QDV35365.1 hypothetical protein ElP_32680 [Tautonia plasticadhaerens]